MPTRAAAAAAVVTEHHIHQQTQQTTWPHRDEPVEGIAHTDLDDLSTIFDIANFDLDSIQVAEAEQFGEHIAAPASTNAAYLDGLAQVSAAHDYAAHLVPDGSQQHAVQNDLKFGPAQAYYGSAWQHYPSPQTQPYSNALQEQQYTAGGQIPPTPNSYEMHGEAGHFLQQQHQHAMFAQQKHLQNAQQMHNMQHANPAHHPAHFTPMTSPSGTPQYAMQPEFTTPGAYFSPLTSPALHAQLQPNTSDAHVTILQQHVPGYLTNPSTAPSSNAPSPVDLNTGDVDMLDSSFNEPTNKKTRRKLVTPRSVGPTARVRQSPIQKPQKRKSGLLTSTHFDGSIVDAQLHRAPTSTAMRNAQTFDSSESGSISPEPLSEALMRPPPRPTAQIPIDPHLYNIDLAAVSRKAAAATPKSILSMRGDNASALSPRIDSTPSSVLATPTVQAVGQMSLDDLELPAAAKTSAPEHRGPQLMVNTARKTPKLGPQSTPSSARLEVLSANSPMLSPIGTMTPTTLMGDRKDSRPSRSLKKRGSVGAPCSAMASPALRPRISPSIKPLLPEGSSLHSPTHALLLASKSNYQNLLEGNHLPGVNYPDSLSTGLTSKRTSHKVAEQGRRNRINEALKEMQSLIPSPSITGKADEIGATKEEDDSPEYGMDDGKEGANAKSNSSKAATVESANRYIRSLKESDTSLKAAILALKQENDEIRRRLAEATGTDMPPIDERDATEA